MKIRRILTIIIAILILFSSFKIVHAKEKEIINLYAKEKLQCLIYKGVLVRNEFVVYNKNGIEYPSYCINRELEGVTVENGGYAVETENLIDNLLVWRAIINGYPYKTIEDLGCNTEMEAFAATKMAVYDMLYNYDWNDFSFANEQGERVLLATKKIAQLARSSNQERYLAEIYATTDDIKWNLESNGEFLSKTYVVSSKADFESYSVSNLRNDVNIKIVDLEDNERNNFSCKEKFKVLLPINELEKSGEFELGIEANLKTFPVYYGKSTVENCQNYAVSGFSYENASTNLIEKYTENKTSITIIKTDGDTKEGLNGCEFSLFDKNGVLFYENLVTNENGKIVVRDLLPGTYFLRETKALEGYIGNDDVIEIELYLDEMRDVNVQNYRNKQEVPNIKLPQTGY